MKTQKILDSILEWDENKIVIKKDSASVSLSQRETVALFVTLREILAEWKSAQKS